MPLAKLTTINIRGFGGEAKTKSIFDFAKQSKADFIFLQETLVARTDKINDLREKWEGKRFWSPAIGKQGGVAVLFSAKTDFEMLNWKKDPSGRIVSVLVSLGDFRCNLINIYAPTNQTDRKVFFDTLPDYFFPGEMRIIAGGFNCIEREKDKFGGTVTTSTDLKDLHFVFNFIDIWRKTHGRQVQCSWFNSSKTIGTRLDKFFVTQNLVKYVKRCEIIPFIHSDHDSVDLIFDLSDFWSHGLGLWKLNLTLLEDEKFCNQVGKVIRSHVLYRDSFPSIHEWWDFLKSSIKIAAQDFSKSKQKRLNCDKVRIINQLIEAKQKLIDGDTSAKALIDRLESELKAIQTAQNEGAKIRSRAQWIEEGEKPTKYFFNLESIRKQKNLVKSIYDISGNEVTSKREIERAHFQFYKNLYSSESVDTKIQEKLLSKVKLRLDENEIFQC